MNRSRKTPLDVDDMLFEGGYMGRKESARYGKSPMRGQMRGRVDELPSATAGGGLKYALGFNTPHRPLATDENTGTPLLLVQPQGSIAQRINDEIRERERQAEIAYQEQQRREEEERQQKVEELLPNASDLSDPLMPHDSRYSRIDARHERTQPNDDSWLMNSAHCLVDRQI